MNHKKKLKKNLTWYKRAQRDWKRNELVKEEVEPIWIIYIPQWSNFNFEKHLEIIYSRLGTYLVAKWYNVFTYILVNWVPWRLGYEITNTKNLFNFRYEYCSFIEQFFSFQLFSFKMAKCRSFFQIIFLSKYFVVKKYITNVPDWVYKAICKLLLT